jgi:hypothetical protein
MLVHRAGEGFDTLSRRLLESGQQAQETFSVVGRYGEPDQAKQHGLSHSRSLISLCTVAV